MTACKETLLVLASLLPLVTRGFFFGFFFDRMRDRLSSAERASEMHRNLVMPLASLSFAALLGLAIANLELDLQFKTTRPFFLLLLSFISLLAAFNLQAYKFYRWVDLLGDALIEVGTFSLVLTLIYFILISGSDGFLTPLIWVAGLFLLIDHLVRLVLLFGYYSALDTKCLHRAKENLNG